MLGTQGLVGDCRKKVVEAMIDDKDQLLKILDRVVEIVFPRDAVFFNIRVKKTAAVLPYNIDHLAKLRPVAVDQIVDRYLLQFPDGFYAQLVKDANRVRFDLKISQRQLVKFRR